MSAFAALRQSTTAFEVMKAASDERKLPERTVSGIDSDQGCPRTGIAPGGQSVSRELVVALHCSGSNAGQWRQLGDMLGDDYTLIAPEHYGNAQIGPWPGGHVFILADEAMQTIALIDRAPRKVHLVGHSYGGGVTLHAALARPHCISTPSLYEPSAFHLREPAQRRLSVELTMKELAVTNMTERQRTYRANSAVLKWPSQSAARSKQKRDWLLYCARDKPTERECRTRPMPC